MSEIENTIDELFNKDKLKKISPLDKEQVNNIAVIETVKEFVPIEKKEEIETQDLDTIQEQVEAPMTTVYSPESIGEDDLKKVGKKPENYIEINIIKKIRLVDSFYIPSNLKHFTYKNIKYNIIEENIYILPTKNNFFMPTSFFYEGKVNPISFKQTNLGITGKALSLLYNSKLYQDLFSGDETKYNLYIVILLIISIAGYFIGLYYLLESIL